MAADIDKLQIRVNASAADASKSLEKLAASMENLKKSLSFDTARLSNIATGIRGLSDAAIGFKGGKSTELTSLSRALKTFNGIDTSSIYGISSALNSLKSGLAGAQGIDVSGIASVANTMSKLGGVKASAGVANLLSIKDQLAQFITGMNSVGSLKFDTAGLANLIGAISKLGYTSANNATKNLPTISAQLQNFVRQMNQIGSLNFDTTNLSQMVAAIGKLGSVASGRAVTNIPLLATNLKQLFVTLSSAPNVSGSVIRMTEALANLSNGLGRTRVATDRASSGFKLFGKSADGARSKSFSLAAAIGKVYATYWMLFRAFGKIRDAIDISSSLTEVENVVRTTFGKYESLVNDFAANSIQKFGMSELSVKQFASRFQAMGVAMGFSQGKMANMSVELTKLTADMASFYDVSQKDVAQDLESIFTGQTRPLRTYGLDLTQATLKEWALNQGIEANFKTMTQAEKAMLRYQYVMANTAAAQGDFARTADTWHNQVTILKQSFQQLAGIVGGALINAFKPLVKTLNAVLQKVISFAEMVTNALGSIFGWKYEASAAGVADDWSDMADSADDVAGSTGDAANNANKLKKNVSAAIRAFDELKTISLQKDNKKSSGGGSGNGTGSGASGGLVATDTIFKGYKSKIKDLEGLGESIRTALVNAVGGIDWDSIYAKAENFGTGLATFLNGLFSSDKKGENVFTATADVIAGALNTAIFASKGFADKFDFEQFGRNVASGFNRFFKKFKWKQCAEAINGWVDGFWKFVHGFFDDLSWKDIFDGLKTFLQNLTPSSLVTLLAFSGGKLAPIVSTALCSILGFKSNGKGGSGKKTFKLNGLGLTAFIATIAFQLSDKKTDFKSSVVEALAAGGAAFYMSNGNPYFALSGVTISVGISLGKFFVENSDKMKKGIKDFKEKINKALGKKTTVKGTDGKDHEITTPLSERLKNTKVHKNAYSGTSSSQLAKNQDWYNQQKKKKSVTNNHATAGISTALDNINSTTDRNSKIKVTAEITKTVDKTSKKAKTLKGCTAGISAAIDNINKEKKILKNYNANLTSNTDKIKLSEKSLNNFNANLSRKTDKIKSSDKILKDFDAILSGNKDKIASSDKSLKNYTANLSKDKDGIKTSDKLLKNYTAKLSSNKDDIKSSNKKLGGFTALITSFVNSIKEKYLDFKAKITGTSGGGGHAIKKANGGVFANGRWNDVKKYAAGGIPNMGQLFIAREAGPELVGNIGGHAAVVNNDQIVASVSDGVARAVASVLGSGGNSNQPIQVYLDGRLVFESTRNYANDFYNRTGRSPYPV